MCGLPRLHQLRWRLGRRPLRQPLDDWLHLHEGRRRLDDRPMDQSRSSRVARRIQLLLHHAILFMLCMLLFCVFKGFYIAEKFVERY